MARTYLLVLLYVVTSAAGDLCLTIGMRQDPIALTWVAVSVVGYGVSYGTFLGLLRDVPLSVVVPAGSSSYLLITALSHALLREAVPPVRWLGTFLVSTGV